MLMTIIKCSYSPLLTFLGTISDCSVLLICSFDPTALSNGRNFLGCFVENFYTVIISIKFHISVFSVQLTITTVFVKNSI